MSKNKMNKKQPAVAPKVEAAEQAEPTFVIKLEIMGAEPVTLNGVNANVMNNIRNWFAGLGSETTEISLADNLLILNRSKIAYLVVGIEEPNEEGKKE